ncbi:hypothetical protein K3172_11230 [Qipengyuania sp. 6B39]|uniref:hypothetical protein n=1 Tax=Qipengyuania proteolytica TaxID=2867239 RepID=UPI001C89A433|nr:hypothetical protein [Qipengyuania proteolytica]MBX7496426.1 hypothetical protein [Qipengyuania proteolytica]
MSDADPTKPTPNSEKFKPQNVKGPLKDTAPDDLRGPPADTEGYDVAHGSEPTTKSTPNA